ncbi:SRPBCC family protein [Solwaraspora sp. WMMA2056]|uniref:SRPBCC family protein n=1 Tax=Solwaraspora sp. WMMA2056 TaxID=3015161 RepID=UPI00259AFA75|nr:SRPBCC family protein [Solwaraspora sp. WMMA2056]WJK42592.1 SRPBCC family protein [Solwaraspora sp. WMMA2056]
MTTGSLRVTAPAPTDIVMTRTFNAPRHLVFDALTRPELLRRWFGAQGWTVVECEVDLRVGGRWRFVSIGPGDMKMGQGGVYQEITRPERLSYTEAYDDQWAPGESLVTAVLTEHAGRTTLTNTLRYPSQEVRDMVLTTPMERGASDSFDRLAELLAST